MSQILERLNEQQKEAVTHKDGPLLILAGAGSGKTRVITRRIAYLLERDWASPHNILALTFTNKASREMQDRVVKLVNDVRVPWIGTFHAMSSKILRRELKEVGRRSDFSILGRSEQLSLIRECLRDLNIDDKLYAPAKILRSIGFAKCQLKNVDKFTSSAHGKYPRTVAKVYKQYEEKLNTHNSFDFDDLITKTVFLFREYPEILEKYHDLFRYILVDEYQDVNHAQYVLAKLLAGDKQNICVVGDDDQSIYGFRGADVSIILRFEKEFNDVKVIKLEENYRSTGIILQAANNVVHKNKGRKAKKLWTQKTSGEKISMHTGLDSREEARYLVKEIKKGLKKGEHSKDFAILYRTNIQSRAIEEVLKQEGIMYDVVGGLRFYERMEVKNAVAYLKLIANPHDYISFRRVINTPSRGIGNVTADKIVKHSTGNGIDLLEVMKNASDLPRVGRKIQQTLTDFAAIIELLSEEKNKLSPSDFTKLVLDEVGYFEFLKSKNDAENVERLENLEELINDAREFEMHSSEKTIEAFLEKIALYTDIDDKKDKMDPLVLVIEEIEDWPGLIKKLRNKKNSMIKRIWSFLDKECQKVIENQKPKQPIETEFKETIISEFNKILENRELYCRKSFKEVELNKESRDILNKGIENLSQQDILKLNRLLLEAAFSTEIAKDDGKVTLMTLHSAKGLEFPTVFIVGLEEELLPHIRSMEDGKQSLLEEERRLFYVGITRATKKLHLTYARERMMYGKTHNQSPSRFLREIPEDLIDRYVPEISKRSFIRHIDPVLKRHRVKKKKSSKFSVGSTVYHKIFGKGEVIKCEKKFVTAQFSGVGNKTLSMDFLSPYEDKVKKPKPGDKVVVEGGKVGIVKKLEGNSIYVILDGPVVEKFPKNKIKLKKD
ncbi:MAG: UvrD-helicase domain-containing protein [Candidatus Eremiobacteraeota bacterium]|nr:UvrD-helicase domain-containing protein [Candidatus Eremiobacteraeota bacterium]